MKYLSNLEIVTYDIVHEKYFAPEFNLYEFHTIFYLLVEAVS